MTCLAGKQREACHHERHHALRFVMPQPREQSIETVTFNNGRLCIRGQVDGFRFDIMGHLMVPTMQKIQRALGALTLEQDGVDGSGIYIYGEAWDFGEVPPLLLLLNYRGSLIASMLPLLTSAQCRQENRD